MSTVQTWRTESLSLEITEALAEQIGHRLHGGETIELISDLGGGKTAFVRGLARGLGSKDIVHSPSFTLSNVYQAGELSLYHFDFHRLDEPGVLRNELAEIISDPQSVVAVEWPAIVDDILPGERLTIKFTPTAETTRNLEFTYPASLTYLLPRNT